MAGIVPEPEVMYFVPASLDPVVFGYTWRIWARSTSFYLAPRSAAVGGLKISLHGPDDRPDLGMPGFKMGIDRQLMSRAEDLGIGIVNGLRGGALNGWFSGRQLRDGSAWHVLTLRWTWDLFQPGVPSAPVPERPRAGAAALRLMAPTELLRVVDVELFVGNEAPYFPEDEVDAGMPCCRRFAMTPDNSLPESVDTAPALHRSLRGKPLHGRPTEPTIELEASDSRLTRTALPGSLSNGCLEVCLTDLRAHAPTDRPTLGGMCG